MERIIIPIDFSGDSINALEHAIKYANNANAELRMIHVKKSLKYDEPFQFKDFDSTLGNSIEDFFEMLIEKYKPHIKTKIDYKIRVGKVYKEVCNQAKYDDSDLIISGSHGGSGFEEYWIGSNAYRIVMNAPCPVITVRNGYTVREVKKIILPIDISKGSRKKIPFTIELAKIFNAEIHVIGVRETDRPRVNQKLIRYSEQAKKAIESNNIVCKTDLLLGDNHSDTIIEYAKKEDAQLISIMTEQAESALNIFVGKYAQQMINNSPIPMLNTRNNY